MPAEPAVLPCGQCSTFFMKRTAALRPARDATLRLAGTRSGLPERSRGNDAPSAARGAWGGAPPIDKRCQQTTHSYDRHIRALAAMQAWTEGLLARILSLLPPKAHDSHLATMGAAFTRQARIPEFLRTRPDVPAAKAFGASRSSGFIPHRLKHPTYRRLRPPGSLATGLQVDRGPT